MKLASLKRLFQALYNDFILKFLGFFTIIEINNKLGH